MDAVTHPARNDLRLNSLWPLIGGLLILAGLWLGPLPELARRAFSPHMILHLAVAVVAAPVLAIGALRAFRQLRYLNVGFFSGLAVSATEFAIVWGWHLPVLHEAAARSPAVFAIQQLTFLVAALALWMVCLLSRNGGGLVAGLLAMLFTCMHMAMLGLLLVLAPALLYAPQYCLGAFGLDPLTDQQLGGGLMVIFGTAPFVVGAAWLALGKMSHGHPEDGDPS